MDANPKTNFLISLLSAVVFSGLFAIVNYFNYKNIESAIVTFVIMAVVLFVAIYLALTITARFYKKRVQNLEDKYKE